MYVYIYVCIVTAFLLYEKQGKHSLAILVKLLYQIIKHSGEQLHRFSQVKLRLVQKSL